MQALFDAVDVSGISTNVSSTLILFVGVHLLFLAYKYIRLLTSRG